MQNPVIFLYNARKLLKHRKDIDIVHLYTIKSTTAVAGLLAKIINKPIATTFYSYQPIPPGFWEKIIYLASAEVVFALTDKYAYETYDVQKIYGKGLDQFPVQRNRCQIEIGDLVSFRKFLGLHFISMKGVGLVILIGLGHY